MRNLTMLTLAVCLLGVGWWSGTARAATFQVIVVSAKVLPTKANRNCWDLCTPWQRRVLFGLSRGLRVHKGKNAWAATMTSAQAALQLQGSTMPDPYVTLRFQNGQVLRSRVLHNTVNPQWGTTVQVDLSKGATVLAEVWDKDTLNRDDKIGSSGMLRVPAHILKRGGAWVVRFGRVHQMTLLFARTKAPPTAVLFPPGLYDVTVHSARLATTKSKGVPWDLWKGKPDPFLRLRMGLHAFETPTESNTYRPFWHFTRRVYLNGTERVSMVVWDRDIYEHDKVGSCRFRTVAQMPFDAKGVVRLRCQLAHSVVLSIRKSK